MTTTNATIAALGIGAALALAAPALRAQDLIVEGCNEQLAGEVGVWQGVGNVGETIAVPITVHATGPIDAFVLNVDLPPGVLSYVRTDRGSLMPQSGSTLRGHFFSATNQVRIEGIISQGSAIPMGATGQIAVVVLQVVAPGGGAFGTSRLLDDLSTYVSCEDIHGTTAVESLRWGRIKAAYR